MLSQIHKNEEQKNEQHKSKVPDKQWSAINNESIWRNESMTKMKTSEETLMKNPKRFS